MPKLLKQAGVALLVVLVLVLVPNALWRALVPNGVSIPATSIAPTADDMEPAFEQAFAKAASDPLAALPMLEDLMFLDHPRAEDARSVATAIQGARLEDNLPYLFTTSGQALADIGEWLLAKVALRRAVGLDPEFAEAWAYLGEAQFQTGEDSLPALNKALELNPDSVAVQLFNALYWQRRGDFEQADLHFFVASQLEPENTSIFIQWGKSAMLAGQPVEARAHFEQAALLSPDDPEVWRVLAEFSVESELFVEELGIPAANKLVTADPNDPEAMVLLGRAYVILGDPETGRVFLERAVELDANYAPGHYFLALFLLSEGETEAALQHLNKVIELAPGTAQAQHASELIIEFND